MVLAGPRFEITGKTTASVLLAWLSLVPTPATSTFNGQPGLHIRARTQSQFGTFTAQIIVFMHWIKLDVLDQSQTGSL